MLGLNKAQPNKVIILVGLALFFCLSANFSNSVFGMAERPQGASFTTIQGRVLAEDTGQSVIGAAVRIYTLTGRVVASDTIKDEQGGYRIKEELSSAMYVIVVSAPNYYEFRSPRRFSRGQIYTINVNLKPQTTSKTPPRITSIIPPDKSLCIIGEKIDIIVESYDAEDYRLEHRYFLDGDKIQDWTGATRFGIPEDKQTPGRHKIKVEVRDGSKQTDSKEIEVYFVRPFPKPVE